MEIRVHEILSDGSLRPVDAETVQPAWVSDDIDRWVDVTGRSAELQALLRTLDVPAELARECMSEPTRPAVLDSTNALVISVPLPAEDDGLVYVTLLFLPTTVLTISESSSDGVHRRLRTLKEARRPSDTSTASVFFRLLINAMHESIPVFFDLRSRTNGLAERLVRDGTSVVAEEIVSLNSQVVSLGDLFQDYRFCLTEVCDAQTDLPVLETIHEHVDGLIEELDQAIAASSRLRDRGRDLAQQHQHIFDEATNRRVGVLTIISAVFLPSTLIAGIYGMNFEHMPALNLRHGYLIVLAVIVLLILLPLLYFRRREWF